MNKQQQSHERFTAVYRVTVNDGRTIAEHASGIALEQTVEVPASLVPQKHKSEGIIGQVEKIVPLSDKKNVFDVSISYRTDITAFNVPQFFSLLYGNISLKKNIRVIDLNLPDSMKKIFPGPPHGIEGIRKLTGIYGRPLACTALKPLGLPVNELASMAAQFAQGGIDIIKDDHGINNQQMHPFKERVARCMEAVQGMNLRTGGRTLYFPTLCDSFETIEEQAAYAVSQGVRGILIAPFLVGPDTVRYLSQRYGLIIMAHPAMAGAYTGGLRHGMTPSVLLGTLFRLLGADISIFPNWGGRFSFTKGECISISDALRKPMGPWKSAFPSPAGGMTFEMLPDIFSAFGEDTVLLIGGGLLSSGNLVGATEQFMNKIRLSFSERLETPEELFKSSCLTVPSGKGQGVSDILTCKNYRWSNRKREDYKTDDSIAHKGISRSELVGNFGERTNFDLRYFEIEPGGFSSFEKHVHEHVVIGVRGKGVLYKNGKEFPIGVNDIGYVGPLEDHQLRNNETGRFGFYCIVDHVRDRPRPAALPLRGSAAG